MKCDPDVKNVQKEALSVVAKCTELFISFLAAESGMFATARRAKTVKDTDVVKAINANDSLSFLREDFPAQKEKPKVANQSRGSKRGVGLISNADSESNKRLKDEETVVTSVKSSLKNFFSSRVLDPVTTS
jgi:hypothetical protein